MNVVAHPLRRAMRRAEVGDLQMALKELLDAQMLGARDDATRRELGAAREAERSESAFGSTTYKLVRLFQEEHGLAVSGEVDDRTAELLNTLVAGLRGDVDGHDGRRHEVRGVVRFESGVPAEGVAVEAVDLGLRGDERVLRRGESIADGTYWLEYLSHAGRDPRRGAANLVVRAVGEDGSPLVESPVLFDPPAQAHIDLTIPRERLAPPSLLSRVQKAVLPLLDDMPIDELDERDGRRDLTVLAGKAGLDTRTLARFALAHRLAGMGMPLEFWFALLGDPSFEYTPELGLPGYRRRALAQLYRLDEVALERTLVAALDAGDIEEASRESLPAWSEEFTQLMAERVLKHSDASSFVTAALEGAGVDDAEAQEELAGLLRRHGSLTRELLATLEEDPRFEEPAIADLSTSFRLADLTRGDFSVVAMVKDEFDVRHPRQLPALARVGLTAWTSLVQEKLEDRSIELPFDFGELEEPLQAERAEIYATTLERRFREAFPTQAFAGELERARENGGAQGLKHADELAHLLDAHDEFELLSTPIDEFLDDRDEPELRRLAKDESFRRELSAVQSTRRSGDQLLGKQPRCGLIIRPTGRNTRRRRRQEPQTACYRPKPLSRHHRARLGLVDHPRPSAGPRIRGALLTTAVAARRDGSWPTRRRSGDVDRLAAQGDAVARGLGGRRARFRLGAKGRWFKSSRPDCLERARCGPDGHTRSACLRRGPRSVPMRRVAGQ